MYAAIAILTVLIAYQFVYDREADRLREQHDAGMQQFWRVYDELPRQRVIEPVP